MNMNSKSYSIKVKFALFDLIAYSNINENSGYEKALKNKINKLANNEENVEESDNQSINSIKTGYKNNNNILDTICKTYSETPVKIKNNI